MKVDLRKMKKAIASNCWAAGFLLLLAVPAYPADDSPKQIIVAKDTQSSILISSAPSETEKFAAQELQTFIHKMTGMDIPIRPEDQTGGNVVFVIGRCQDSLQYLDRFDKRLIGPGSDSFIIKAKDNRIILLGGGDRGTLYSVYALLEQQGCRWFMPGELGEVIPELTRLVIPECDELEVPDFIQRELQGQYAPCSDDEKLAWHAKIRINRENDLAIRISRKDERWSKRGNYLNWSRLFHNYQFILPPTKYFDEHPEYYSLYKGQRIPTAHSQGSVCTTNPEVIERFAEYINWWFKNNPDGPVFSLWPPDGAIKWCECDSCLALGGRNFTNDPAAMSRRHITFANEIARKVYPAYPDRLILLCAYHPNYLDPVMDIKLEKNVIIQIIHSGCHAHAINKCWANKKQQERFENWVKIAPGGLGSPALSDIPLLTWDDYVLSPRPVARRIIDNLQYVHSLGGRYYYAQSGSIPDRKDTIYYSPFPYYVVARYTWDVNTDYQALCDDFFGKFYGNVGPALNLYWNLLEDAVQQADYWHPEPWSEGALPSAEAYTPELLKQAEIYLQQAESLGETEIIQKRLSFMRQSFDFLKASVGQKSTFTLETTDEYYVLNEGQSVFEPLSLNSPHQDQAVKRSTFRSLKTRLPVKTLENDRIAVSLVPALGGRIVKLLDKKTATNFMWTTPDQVSVHKLNAFYLVYGGYEELVGTQFPSPGWELPYLDTLTDDDHYQQIVLESQVEDFLVRRTIRLEKGDSPELAVDTQITNQAAVERTIGLFVHPVMNIQRSFDPLYLSMALKDGTVKKTHITVGLNDQPCGRWAVVDEIANVGIVNYFDPTQASAKLHLDKEHTAFNMELVGGNHTLTPGESFTLGHRYRVLDDALSQVNSHLQKANN